MLDIQELCLEIEFSFISPMDNDYDPTNFVNEIKFKIISIDEEENRELIGKGMFSLILLERALNYDMDLYSVMDATQSIIELVNLLDLDNYIGIFDKIEAFYPDEEPIFNSNIALLDRIEILPKYRGLGISAKTIKRICEQFYGWFDLIILKAYPLQYDSIIKSDISNWHTDMNYCEHKSSFEKSQEKLFKLYRKIGFENPFGDDFFISRTNKIISHQ